MAFVGMRCICSKARLSITIYFNTNLYNEPRIVSLVSMKYWGFFNPFCGLNFEVVFGISPNSTRNGYYNSNKQPKLLVDWDIFKVALFWQIWYSCNWVIFIYFCNKEEKRLLVWKKKKHLSLEGRICQTKGKPGPQKQLNRANNVNHEASSRWSLSP